ncbi:MAG: hypothetical protein D3917_17315 [Candidatus Electrothrix sp. AX5]|nr:hypothetical protein [Candidatus Electrothrix sp. AX5]
MKIIGHNLTLRRNLSRLLEKNRVYFLHVKTAFAFKNFSVVSILKYFLTVTDLGEGSSQLYKPLNVKHEKSVRYLQPV